MSPRTVSIIIPAYNAAKYLPEAFDCAFGQTLPPHEVIVIDDGSKDDTAAVCERYAGKIRYFRQENAGETAARNTALGLATGAFISLLDADDRCAPDRLEKQVNAMASRPDAIACFSGHWTFDDNGRTGEYPGTPENASRSALDYAAGLYTHPITMMFRREATTGMRFPPGVFLGGDMLFTGLLRRRGAFVIVPDVLYGYRRHPGQITAKYTEFDSLHQRLNWMKAHAAEVWPELDVAAYEKALWDALADGLKNHYWARRRPQFFSLRDRLAAEWPGHLPKPPELNLRWYPDVVWKAKGLVDAARRRFRKATPAGGGA